MHHEDTMLGSFQQTRERCKWAVCHVKHACIRVSRHSIFIKPFAASHSHPCGGWSRNKRLQLHLFGHTKTRRACRETRPDRERRPIDLAVVCGHMYTEPGHRHLNRGQVECLEWQRRLKAGLLVVLDKISRFGRNSTVNRMNNSKLERSS